MEGCGGAWNRNVLEGGHRKVMSQSGTWGVELALNRNAIEGVGEVHRSMERT